MTEATMQASPKLGRPEKYPWASWLVPDGQARLLERGVHYDCMTLSFVRLFTKQAKRRGLTPHWKAVPSSQTLEDAEAVAIWVTERD